MRSCLGCGKFSCCLEPLIITYVHFVRYAVSYCPCAIGTKIAFLVGGVSLLGEAAHRLG